MHNTCQSRGSKRSNIRHMQERKCAQSVVCVSKHLSTHATHPFTLKYKDTGGDLSTPVNTWELSYRLARLQPNVITQQTQICPDPAVMEDRSHVS